MRRILFLFVGLSLFLFSLFVQAAEVLSRLEGPQAGGWALEQSESAPKVTELLVFDEPDIEQSVYALRGQVRCQGVVGKAYLEMWNHFDDGKRFFSRSLSEQGPLKVLTGDQDWRLFVLPFNNTRPESSAPTRLVVNLVMPGKGRVELRDLELVQFEDGEDPTQPPGAWLSGSQVGFLGAMLGALLGLMGGLIGIFAGRLHARGLLKGLLVALGLFGLAAFVLLFLLSCSGDDGPKLWEPPPHTPVNPVTLTAEDLPEDELVFPAGVMAGEPEVGGMTLWALVRTEEAVRLKVWLPDVDPADADLVDLLWDKEVEPGLAGTVHARVEGLIPGRWHAYAFFVQDGSGQATARSPIGHFSAAPPPGALVRLTLSGTHGTHQRETPYPTLIENAIFEPFTLYLHLGDAIYADDAESLDDYRRMWTENWQTEGFRGVLKDAIYLPVADDHELINDYSGETIDPERWAMGIQSLWEFNPLKRMPENPDRLWRSWRWGDTLELFALDCRSERKPSTRHSLDAQYISPEQMEWLKQGLTSSSAVFKLVLNSVPIMDMPYLWLKDQDRWEGYPVQDADGNHEDGQREALIHFIRDAGVENVYFVTGDFHMATVGRLDPPGKAGEQFWEFMMGPGAQSNPLGDRDAMIEAVGLEFDPLPPEQFLWGYPSPTMTYVDFDPVASPPEMRLRYYDPEGNELFQVTFAGGQPLPGI
ncbi:MAG: alkaline phosphatase D family protein [Deltaproteobacteria bacterium]|nr:alkaline phosphatase D family protein [Deltaproteobacteria bacterium]